MNLRVACAAFNLRALTRRHAFENISRRYISVITNSRRSFPSTKYTLNNAFMPTTCPESAVCISLFHTTSTSWKERVVKCPPFAESVSEGDIHWEKAEGDSVAEDDLVAGIETDKVNVPVHAPCAGKILQFLVKDGDKVTANQELFKMEEGAAGASESKPQAKGDAPSKEAPAAPEKKAPVSKPAAPAKPSADWEAKKVEMAKELKDLQVKSAQKPASSTTPAARSEDDLLLPSERNEHRVKINRMRKRIAQRLKDAQNTAAMLTTFNEVDMSSIFAMRAQYKEAFQKKHNVKLGFMSAFCKAAAMALKGQPEVNAVIDGDEILYRDYVDISIAVATPKGLVVPVLRNVEHMNFAQIEKGIHALGEKARQNALAVEDMDGGTFTISNGGVFGSLFGTPIINPPQSAILGLHAVNQRPVVVSGEGANAKIEARPMMFVALTYDHRLIDGREAVTFLRKIKAFIEDPRIVLLDL